MTMARIDHSARPHTAAASFLGRLLRRRTPPPSGACARPLAIDPAILEAMLTTGGWVSWEMAHFISETASERTGE
jgi:hypothetical protein